MGALGQRMENQDYFTNVYRAPLPPGREYYIRPSKYEDEDK